MAELEEQNPNNQTELFGPDEFVWHETGAKYRGTYIQNEEGDPIMHGKGEYKIGPERYTWPDQRRYRGQWNEGRLHKTAGEFINFVTVDEMMKKKVEKELNSGRQLLEKEVMTLWQNLELKKTVELGRDVFSGLCMHDSFISVKQDDWKKSLEAETNKGDEEA